MGVFFIVLITVLSISVVVLVKKALLLLREGLVSLIPRYNMYQYRNCLV